MYLVNKSKYFIGMAQVFVVQQISLMFSYYYQTSEHHKDIIKNELVIIKFHF